MSSESMSLEPGAKLASHEIFGLIGAGGMGEAYRAKDTKLGREVAIKVLAEELARDEERLARFEREARILAALNHPGIATLQGLEQDFALDVGVGVASFSRGTAGYLIGLSGSLHGASTTYTFVRDLRDDERFTLL